MRIGQQVEAAAAAAQQRLGRPPGAAELATAAGRELATLGRLGAAGGPAAAAALARYSPTGLAGDGTAALPAGQASFTAAAAASLQQIPMRTDARDADRRALPAGEAAQQPGSGAGGGARSSRRAQDPGAAAERLTAAVADGRRARRILRDSQLRLVVRVASRYQHSAPVTLEDLVQVQCALPPASRLSMRSSASVWRSLGSLVIQLRSFTSSPLLKYHPYQTDILYLFNEGS